MGCVEEEVVGCGEGYLRGDIQLPSFRRSREELHQATKLPAIQKRTRSD